MRRLTQGPALAALLLALLAAPAGADELDEVLALFAAHRHGAASFVEQHFVHLLSRPVESLGELRFDAPDRLEMRTLEPRPEQWLVEGDTLTLTRRGRTHVAALADHPQLRPLIDGIRGTLAGDRRALEHVFTVHFLGDSAHWSLVLVPLAGQAGAQIQQVQIDGVRDRLLEVDLREADGDRTVLTLRTHEGR
jgi:outer membrane lipoprotein-sorting protein